MNKAFPTLQRGSHVFGTSYTFKPVQVGPYEVSIQASENHYCTPRENYASADPYTSFEVAIFRNDWFVLPQEDARFKGREWAHKWTAQHEVGSRVSREEVVQLLADLRATLD